MTDLVIDFRYNGGGLVSVADTMLDLLGGLVAEDEDSWRIIHNDMRSYEDFGAVFAALPNSMEPLRIAFITTGATASASELVINSLVASCRSGADRGRYLRQGRWAVCI